MDRPDKRNKKEKKSPRTPIRTYRWEDVRRARKRGGYPWTYLYKPAFNEALDPEPYTMEGMRKAKSTSTMGKSYLTISEVIESDREGSSTPDFPEKIDTTLQIVTEPDDHSLKINSTSSLIIEECETSERGNKKLEFIFDSAESSDDISQYLDKEDRVPSDVPCAEPDEATKDDDDTSKRKRKLSAESSYSRISQTKSAIIKKLKETKAKIKLPKLSLPVSKLKKSKVKKSKSSPVEFKKELKKSHISQNKSEKPLYIHIPLKLPPGENYESHVEDGQTSNTSTKKSLKRPGGFKDLVKQLQGNKLESEPEETKQIPQEKNIDTEELIITQNSNKQHTDFQENIENKQADTNIEKPDNGNIIQEDNQEQAGDLLSRIENRQPNKDEIILHSDDAVIDSVQQQIRDLQENRERKEPHKDDKNSVNEHTIGNTIQNDNNERDYDLPINIENTLDKDKQKPEKNTSVATNMDITEEPSISAADETNLDIFDKLFKKTEEEPLPLDTREVRSKSVELEKKRKLSLESTFSRKSLSKLGIIKKLKEASHKIKSNLTRSTSKKEVKVKEEGLRKEDIKSRQLKQIKPVEPVYIHIPLKPPDGETDEFSYLENEGQTTNKPAEITQRDSTTPESPTQNGVQFIILTAPSDDEILDYHSSDVPETPSSGNKIFFGSKEELTELAKDAADTVTVLPSKHKLEPVNEENGNEKSTEMEGKISKVKEMDEKVVDVEDGLSESKIMKVTSFEEKSPIENNQSGLKGSPVIKKKVSFKRRSKTPKEGSYEDIQTPVDESEKLADQSTFKEEMTKSDQKNAIPFEEDDEKWSIINDHEYEPVNLPPDITISSPPSSPSPGPEVYVIDTDLDPSILPLGSVPVDTTSPTISSDATPNDNARLPSFVTFASVEEDDTELTKSGPSKFQRALKEKTDNFKSKLHNIHLPQRPKFNKPNMKKFKIVKPKFSLPKIPDKTKISIPSFSLPRKHSEERTLKERQLSTESNVGDSKKPIFGFSTYPRLFKKKQKTNEQTVEFATVPRSAVKRQPLQIQEDSRWSGSDSVRIPLHSEDCIDDAPDADEETKMEPSHIRYEQDIDIDDESERENNEMVHDRDFVHRWNRGRFNPDINDRYAEKITDLDFPETHANRDNYSSGSSAGMHRSGVLEEINSDEFLWRQKGISQEDMDVRLYLSSEIKEAFRSPNNALSQLDRHYDLLGSNQSLPGTHSKRKPIRKPKKKKTPHASQEQIPYIEDSASEDFDVDIPSRPKRRNKLIKKTNNIEGIVPYQETINVDVDVDVNAPEDRFVHRESIGGILGDDEGEEESFEVGDPYKNFENMEQKPAAPPRKHKSLKSLTVSETGSIIDDFHNRITPQIEVIIPIEREAPKRPTRTRSRTNSQSIAASQKDDDSLSRRSLSSEQIPYVEEPCIKDIRDSMGYAVIDKSKARDPPLPPPRVPRRKKSSQTPNNKFFTVPRTRTEQTPLRPLRNYSTLVQAKTNLYKNKENIDIIQYVEIDEEPNRDLQSGDVIKKMKDRPLPAPPRPPRKSRALQDITLHENIVSDPSKEMEKLLEEIETATQTEPLPEDFVCEEVVQEPTDTIITPTKIERDLTTPTHYGYEETITHGSLLVQPLNGSTILPDSEIIKSAEYIIPIVKEGDFKENTFEPPELKNVSNAVLFQPQKLKINGLDVDTLTVNRLFADKIVVSEIESGSLQAEEISSQSGTSKAREIDLPAGVIEGIIKTIHAASSPISQEEPETEEKKTWVTENLKEEISNSSVDEVPNKLKTQISHETESRPSSPSIGINAQDISEPPGFLEASDGEIPPPRPPRRKSSLPEPEVDDEPPPRPPQPQLDYIPSQPPASFYALRAQKYVDSLSENIPVVPKRRRHARSRPRTRSSSEDSSEAIPISRRLRRRSSDPSLPQLSWQLVQACGAETNDALKRLITYLLNNVLGNQDGKQDLNIMIIIVLVLIAGLILLGYGDERTVVHLHHWEYFNPPRDL